MKFPNILSMFDLSGRLLFKEVKKVHLLNTDTAVYKIEKGGGEEFIAVNEKGGEYTALYFETLVILKP